VDHKELISSGLLESYVLGIASPEEVKNIQQLQKEHPEIRIEIETIEASLMEYAGAYTSAPSGFVKNKISERLFTEQNKMNATVVQLVPEKSPAIRSSLMRFALAASVILLIGSIGINYLLYSKLNNTQKELSDLNNERSVLANQYKSLETSFGEKNKELAMMMDPSNKMVSLKGMGAAPTATATIIWSMKDKSVYINVASLPMPPSGMQYQLWALVDGKPVDAGVVTMEDGKFIMQKMKTMENAQAFAVTLEKIGGSLKPNMDAMYLMGNV
jgi:anti-sigma-K factor RskA